MLAAFLGLNPKESYLSLEKERENFCLVFLYSIKWASEIRTFLVTVVQRWLRNVQKSVMHVQSCCLLNLTLSLPECLMEFCKVTLTFESMDEIL